MLISPVMPMVSVYRLPHGQYGYSGHVINLPQDIAGFVTTLPRHANELDIIVVRKEGSSPSQHHDFRVRRSVVLSALQFLIANNKYFSNITINNETLLQLPQDGDLPSIPVITFDSQDTMDTFTEPDAYNVEQDTCNTTFSSTFIPSNCQTRTEQENVMHSLQQHQSNSILSWPDRGQSAINEFSNEGYFSCAFPTLYPTGAADFLAPRIHAVTIGNYFKHLMLYNDGRFAKHCRFRYFALNTEMRWRALQTGRIYIRQNPEDDHLTIEDLRDMVGREGENFSNHVLHYAASLRGTRKYWMRQRSRLIAMVDTLGMPTIFFTHSAADLQWPELARLFATEYDRSYSQATALIENPALAD